MLTRLPGSSVKGPEKTMAVRLLGSTPFSTVLLTTPYGGETRQSFQVSWRWSDGSEAR